MFRIHEQSAWLAPLLVAVAAVISLLYIINVHDPARKQGQQEFNFRNSEAPMKDDETSGVSHDRPQTEIIKTAVSLKTCTPIHSSAISIYREARLGALQCPGLDRYTIYLVTSDTESWIDIATDSHIWTIQKIVTPIEGFTNLVEAFGGEWHVDSQTDTPRSLIIKVASSPPSGVGEAQSLFIILGFRKSDVCLRAIAHTVESAREIAQSKKDCDQTLPLRR